MYAAFLRFGRSAYPSVRVSLLSGEGRATVSHTYISLRTGSGHIRLVVQLSAVARADGSLALAVLATCYGAAGMSMWYQRERSLVPCSLMALIR